jgi:hypothetical protein
MCVPVWRQAVLRTYCAGAHQQGGGVATAGKSSDAARNSSNNNSVLTLYKNEQPVHVQQARAL